MWDLRSVHSRTNLAFTAAAVLGLPVMAGGAWLLSGGAIPIESLAVMAGVYLMAIWWSVMNLLDAKASTSTSLAMPQSAATVSAESMRLMQSWPALELMPSLSAQGTSRSIEITAAVGICPRGFKEGDRITVEPDGTLSRPICRTAGPAVHPALEAGVEFTNGGVGRVSCLCPLALRHLTFSVDGERAVSLN